MAGSGLARSPGSSAKVGEIQSITRHLEHADRIGPLAVGRCVAQPVPVQLQRNDIFSAGDDQLASRIGTDRDPPAAIQLLPCHSIPLCDEMSTLNSVSKWMTLNEVLSRTASRIASP
jgi:hypothetical protein